MDVAGLAIASAASCTVNALILFVALQKRKMKVMDKGLLIDIGKMAVASAVMAVAVKFVLDLLGDSFGKLITLCVPICVGVIVYYVLTLVLNVWESKIVIKFAKTKLLRR